MYRRLTDVKIKEDTFVGSLHLGRKNKWNRKASAFQGVVGGFWVKKNDENYKELVKKLIKYGLSHVFKTTLLCSLLDFFQEILGDFIDEHRRKIAQTER